MARHHCNLLHCDGTKLGHELAQDFPAETARINEAFDDLRERLRWGAFQPLPELPDETHETNNEETS